MTSDYFSAFVTDQKKIFSFCGTYVHVHLFDQWFRGISVLILLFSVALYIINIKTLLKAANWASSLAMNAMDCTYVTSTEYVHFKMHAWYVWCIFTHEWQWRYKRKAFYAYALASHLKVLEKKWFPLGWSWCPQVKQEIPFWYFSMLARPVVHDANAHLWVQD